MVFLAAPGHAAPPEVTLTLAWNYSADEQGTVDYFVLERQLEGGPYTPLPVLIMPDERIAVDETVEKNETYCYRLYAVQDAVPPLRSEPSNVACGKAKPGKNPHAGRKP